jgi:tetratricopeptide (TPR) repeat protein
MAGPSTRYPGWLAWGALGGLAAILASALGWFRRPVVGERLLASALAAPASAEAFEDDGIRFFEERLRRRGGSDPLARRRLAGLHLSRFRGAGDLRDLARARGHLDTLLAVDSADGLLHARQSEVHLAAHRFTDALESARRAMALAPRHPAPRLALFDALLALDRKGEAGECLAALEGGPGSGVEGPGRGAPGFAVLARQALLHEASGRLREALEALDRARARAQAFAQPPGVIAWCRVRSGNCAAKLRNSGEAARHFAAALSAIPGHPPALEGLARLAQAEDGDLDAARRLYLGCLRRGGGPYPALDLMRLELEAGRPAEAERWKARFLAGARAHPDLVRMHRRPLALVLMESPDTRDTALDLALAELEDRPTAESRSVLAWAYYRRGAMASAYAESRAAMDQDPRRPDILRRAALIAWHAGRKGEAESLLARSREILGSGAGLGWRSMSPEMYGLGAATPDPALMLDLHGH